jgi:hypothetical protein
MSNVAAFSSVKLPGGLVSQAKAAAQVMRRSTAGQIEYWAMLGRAVEAGGLSIKDAAKALEPTPQAVDEFDSDALFDGIVELDASGALARAVREQVALQASRAKALAA